MEILLRGGVTSAYGFKAGGVRCGLKRAGKDLAIIYSQVASTAAGVFTRNQVKSAPVLYSQKVLRRGILRAGVINSGNANACTGKRGLANAEKTADVAASVLNVPPREVFVASTGIIGHQIDMKKIEKGIKKLAPAINIRGASGAAEAIMTTDTRPKKLAVRVPFSGGDITIGGMAKGAGMICPDMATMLAFLTTDADIDRRLLSRALKSAVDKSFNSITVDGDSSTNDTVIIMASGLAPVPAIASTSNLRRFQNSLDFVCIELAKQIVKDGEGATKFVEIEVFGSSRAEAKKVALAIANSNLVKTAMFGGDPNWGRIMAAIGRSGVKISPDQIDIYLDRIKLVSRGEAARYNEKLARRTMAKSKYKLRVDLRTGKVPCNVWTCDLSYGYIEENATYTT